MGKQYVAAPTITNDESDLSVRSKLRSTFSAYASAISLLQDDIYKELGILKRSIVSPSSVLAGNVILSPSTATRNTIQPTAVGATNLVLKAFAGQTAKALEIQSSAGAVVGSISVTGVVGSMTWNGATIGPTYGGTGLSTYTAGDTLYSSATNVLAKLAKGTLNQVYGMDASAAIPEWKAVTITAAGVTVIPAGGSLTVASTTPTLFSGANVEIARTSDAGEVYLKVQNLGTENARVLIFADGAGAGDATLNLRTAGTGSAYVRLNSPASDWIAYTPETADGDVVLSDLVIANYANAAGVFAIRLSGVDYSTQIMQRLGVGAPANGAHALYVNGTNMTGVQQSGSVVDVTTTDAATDFARGGYFKVSTSALPYATAEMNVVEAAEPTVGAGSSITKLRMFYANTAGGSVATHKYGLQIESVIGGVTTNRAIQTGAAGDVLLGYLAGAGTRIATVDATGILGSSTAASFGLVSGTGTANTGTKWTGTNTIGNGSWTDDGTTWAIGSIYTITVSTGATKISGNVRIGSQTAPTVALDVTGAALISSTLSVGTASGAPTRLYVVGGSGTVERGIQISDVETNATSKVGAVKVGHYTNAEEPMSIIYGTSTSTFNSVVIGGGTSVENASTEIRFYTGATTTTTTGTDRGGFNSSGAFDLSGNLVINTNKFIVAASSGNTSVAGTLSVTGLIDGAAGFLPLGGSGTKRLYYSASDGIVIRGGTSSINDFSLVSVVGNYLIQNPTGTNNLTVGYASATTTIPGAALISSTLGVTNNINASRYLNMTSTTENGIALGATVSTSDLIYISPLYTGLVGSTQRGFLNQIRFSSAATTLALGMQLAVGTQAASFTTTKLSSLLISDVTKGAGSTITTQIGLEISNQTQGGTNWSIQSGTAQSYFAGNMRIGAATAPTVALDVTGAALISSTLGVTGVLTMSAVPKFAGTNTTGAGTALLGANSPASTLSAPYTWIQVTTADGSTAYVPAWK